MAGSGTLDGIENGGDDSKPPSKVSEVFVEIPEEEQQEEVKKGGVVTADADVDARVAVVDIGQSEGRGDGDGEKVCRICHVSPDLGDVGSELIELGCGCKDDLGIAHKRCAIAWFRLKGNRLCEICGANAKNVTGEGEECGSFIDGRRGRRLSGTDGSTNSSYVSERSEFWRRQPYCNILAACLVIAFILPWFFRINLF